MANRRGPGEGTVFKRKDRNLWQCTITVGHDKNGRPIRKSAFGKTKEKCIQKKTELEIKYANAGSVPVSEKLTVAQLLQKWLSDVCEKKLKRSTVASYRGILANHIEPVIGRVKVNRLGPLHISNVLSKMEEQQKTGSTRKHAYTVLNSALKWAIKMDLALSNPCQKIEPPKPDETEQDVYTAEELKKFLKAAKGHRLEAVFILAVCTGARQGEILGLQWSDLDLERGQVSIRRKIIEIGGKVFIEEPKTKSSKRQVTLPQMAVDALLEHRKKMLAEGLAGISWVFPSKSGQPIRRQSFNRWAHKAIQRKAKLRFIPFKNLRHSHATALLASGEHPKIVQERLGHSRYTTTMDIYSHVIPSMQAETARKIDLLFSEPKKKARKKKTG